MNEALSKFFDKIPTDNIYEDLFQPGLKKAGLALETTIDFSNTILLPLKLLNEKSKIRLNNHLKNYEEKLNNIQEEDICQVPEYIGLPVIDKLMILDQNDLANAFINLLTKASTYSTLELAHPAFIQTLANLSVDEAKILFHIKDKERVAFLDLKFTRYKELIPAPDHLNSESPKSRDQLKQQIAYTFQDREETILKVATNLTGLENTAPIDFKKNIDMYIENMSRLGLINFERDLFNLEDTEIYNDLENIQYKSIIDEYQEEVRQFDYQSYKLDFSIHKGYIEFSEFGKSFLTACIQPIEETHK